MPSTASTAPEDKARPLWKRWGVHSQDLQRIVPLLERGRGTEKILNQKWPYVHIWLGDNLCRESSCLAHKLITPGAKHDHFGVNGCICFLGWAGWGRKVSYPALLERDPWTSQCCCPCLGHPNTRSGWLPQKSFSCWKASWGWPRLTQPPRNTSCDCNWWMEVTFLGREQKALVGTRERFLSKADGARERQTGRGGICLPCWLCLCA